MTAFGVCMISTHFYPLAGGAEKQAERLSNWLIDHDIPVMMVTKQVEGSPRQEDLNGITIYRVPVLKGKVLGALSFMIMGTLTLLRHRRKYQVIHSHQIYSPTTIGWIAARLLGRPLVINLHLGGEQGDIQRLLRNPRMGRLRLNVLKRDADAFIAISKEILEEMRAEGIPEDKIHFLVNAVDPAVFHPVDTEAKQAMRQKLGLPVDSPIAIFIGRLEQIKGVHDLLAAWRDVPDPAHLVIVGTGGQEDTLKAYALEHLSGRVTFTGKRDNIPEFLQATDTWVLPSYGEGLPVALLEAMSTGIPVVTTPVGAIPEIITTDENGLLVESGDVPALTEALKRAIQDDETMRQIGSKARQTVIDGYSLDSVSNEYKTLFESLVKKD